jgi:hypothetical protein
MAVSLFGTVRTVHIYRLPGGRIIIADPETVDAGSAVSTAFE